MNEHLNNISNTLSKVISDLHALPGHPTVLTHPDELELYSCDGLKLHTTTPGCVVLPATTTDIQNIVRICNRYKIPFTARGAGTSLSGGATSEGGVIIQLSRMNQIVEIDYPNRCAIVQPGVVNAYLSLMTRPNGYHFAPDPSSQIVCTIGGNVAENAGGPHTLKYGVTLNHILGLTVVLPDGEILKLGGKFRYSTGMDLIPIMTGSEGTLGVVSEIIVNLEPLPKTARTFLLIFDEVAKATDMVSEILEAGIIPAALEMIDKLCIQAVESTIKAGYPISAEAVLLLELDGDPLTVESDSQKLRSIVASKLSEPMREAQNQTDRALLWKGRKHAAGSMGRLSPAYYTNDGVVPRHRLTETLSEIYRIGQYHQLRVANLCHAGDGNIHPLILYNPQKSGETQRSVDCSVQILKTCLDFGGSLTGEHGIGAEKKDLLPNMYSELYLYYAEEIRKIFNPHNLANPGKIFPESGGCGEFRSIIKRTVR
ncbi:MAG: FAD-binding protein [Candidatus Marinimicrobia bacterium]|nr:FAD-binding protein [Candidatus Neomarinimicrobiota bacterium]